MKSIKKVLTGSVAASMLVAGGLGMSSVATAGELGASVAISNMYLFRGVDMGAGNAAVSGDLVYSDDSGLYAGVWVSSGDTRITGSSEYDYFAGWAGEVGGLGIDVGVINYNYSGPDLNGAATGGNRFDDTTGELSEAYLLLSFGGFDLGYWDNIAGVSDYEYYTIGYTHEKYSLTYGMAEYDSTGTAAAPVNFYQTGVRKNAAKNANQVLQVVRRNWILLGGHVSVHHGAHHLSIS